MSYRQVLCRVIAWPILALMVMVGSGPAGVAQNLQTLLADAPACHELPGPPRGAVPSTQQPYMPAMRTLGIRRAVIDVDGIWRRGTLTRPSIRRQLYFHCYDCPFGQITDLKRLVRIERSPLTTVLERAALGGALAARPARYIDNPPKIEGKCVQVPIMLFDAPRAPASWAAQFWAAARPCENGRQPLARALAAIEAEDSLALACLLRGYKFDTTELSTLLLSAVHSDGERAAEIELLGAAGANANATGRDGDLPLQAAIASDPLNVLALLDIGADPAKRNDEGKSALDLAQWAATRYRDADSRCVLGLLTAAVHRSAVPGSRR